MTPFKHRILAGGGDDGGGDTGERAQRLLYRFRICTMKEIHEKSRPRVCDRYLDDADA